MPRPEPILTLAVILPITIGARFLPNDAACRRPSPVLAATPGRAPAGKQIPGELIAVRGYTLRDLGTLGGRSSWAVAINGNGLVVGRAMTVRGEVQACVFRTRAEKVGAEPGGLYGAAQDINDGGQVVGLLDQSGSGDAQAFVLTGGKVQSLSSLGSQRSEAYGINRRGQVVGFFSTSRERVQRAFLYENGTYREVETLGGRENVAVGINDAGQVVGYSLTANNTSNHAFRWRAGSSEDLGTLGGQHSAANAINTAGHVVGWAENASGKRHAFLFKSIRMEDLDVPGSDGSEALGINDAGAVVGVASDARGARRACLFRSGRVQDLNRLLPSGSGWVLQEARGINNDGQIAGTGMHHGRTRAFLLTPRRMVPRASSAGPPTGKGSRRAP